MPQRLPRLNVEAEERHVAVLHHIILALAADKALFLAGGHAAKLLQRFKRNNPRPYKAALKVRMNLALRIVHARHSSGPAVRKEISPSKS